jgi:ABC-type transport system involved in Fe-S cluster assembly fused permease/ATPase subunit
MVRIDGMNVREMNIIRFRGFTTLAGQEHAMFSGSVRDNISFGKPEADEDDTVKATHMCSSRKCFYLFPIQSYIDVSSMPFISTHIVQHKGLS